MADFMDAACVTFARTALQWHCSTTIYNSPALATPLTTISKRPSTYFAASIRTLLNVNAAIPFFP